MNLWQAIRSMVGRRAGGRGMYTLLGCIISVRILQEGLMCSPQSRFEVRSCCRICRATSTLLLQYPLSSCLAEVASQLTWCWFAWYELQYCSWGHSSPLLSCAHLDVSPSFFLSLQCTHMGKPCMAPRRLYPLSCLVWPASP